MQPLYLERNADGIGILWIDVPGETVNTLRADFSDSFTQIIQEVASDPTMRGLVIASKKADSFVVGADVKMLADVHDAQEASMLSRRGQEAFQKLADLRIPTVAAIHGPCLGGGLELALACKAIIISNDEKTVLGLPEVQLGLIPGAGGTQRLPKLIGLINALDLILSGRKIRAKKAVAMGLAHEAVPPSIVLQVARDWALKRSQGRLSPRAPKGRWIKTLQSWLLEKNPFGKWLLFKRARSNVIAKTGGLYPAPLRAIDVLSGCGGFEAEAKAFGDLAVSPQARALMHIFFSSTSLKKDTGMDSAAQGDVSARPIQKVAVLGAGLMGAGIAHVTVAQAKIPTRLKDRNNAALGRGLAHIRRELDAKVKRKILTSQARAKSMQMVTSTTDYNGFQNTDVVIEAVFEDLEIKHQVLREIESVTRQDTVFASNTSALPIGKIAEASRHPETVIGMHYFSPVEKMPLLEVIVTPKTAPWVTATCVQLGKMQGKTVIVVNDGVGFYTTRILAPYMNEAAYLIEAGVSVDAIDAALIRFGFPVGPVALLDEVGIDVGHKVGHTLHEAFGERMKPPSSMQRLLDDQRLGRKNQRGFYDYRDEKRKGKRSVDRSVYRVLGIQPSAQVSEQEIQERCVLMMVQEAMRCLDEGILRSARDGDIGAIFGLGFPPFLGGPFWYAKTLGQAHIVERLRYYAQRVGPRFNPPDRIESYTF